MTGGDLGHGHAEISVQRLHVPKEQVLGKSPELRPRPARRSDLPGTARGSFLHWHQGRLGHVGLEAHVSDGTSPSQACWAFRWAVPGSLCVCVLRSRVQHPRTRVCTRGTLEGRKEGGRAMVLQVGTGE